MLENLVDLTLLSMSFPRKRESIASDNVLSADNQQERLEEFFQNPQRLYVRLRKTEMI